METKEKNACMELTLTTVSVCKHLIYIYLIIQGVRANVQQK